MFSKSVFSVLSKPLVKSFSKGSVLTPAYSHVFSFNTIQTAGFKKKKKGEDIRRTPLKKILKNEEILNKTIRVVYTESGSEISKWKISGRREALQFAQQMGQDLILGKL